MPTDLFAVTDGGASASPIFSCEVPGHPRGKGRPRGRMVFPRGGKPFVTFYTDAATVAEEKKIAQIASIQMKGRPLIEGPLAVRIFAMMPIPKSWPERDKQAALVGTKFPTTSNDCDNIAKIGLDSLNGVVYGDDRQIVRLLIVKEYAEHPGLIIEVYRLP